MNYLFELAGILNKNKLKASGLWNVLLEPGSKMELLYDLVHDGRAQTDEEAAALLYGNIDTMQRLHSLKNKLKDRLIDGLYLLDVKEQAYTDRQRAFFECNKNWAAVQVLMARNLRQTGLDVLEKILRQSLRFEFTELALNATRLLRLHYGSLEGNERKYQQINARHRLLEQLWMRENRAEELYALLTMQFVQSKSNKPEIAELARQYYEEVKPWLRESKAFKLHLLGRLIQITIYTASNEYQQTMSLCEEAISFFNKKPYNSGLPLQVFYYQLIVCYIQLREFEKGQALIHQIEGYFEEGSFNWFKLQELFFLLAMHSGQYADGAAVCNRILRHSGLGNQPAHVQEMWKIYEAYVQYLIRTGNISGAEMGKQAGKFKLSKFLNEIPVFSKDKRGMNIPILIIQILFLLSEHKYDQCIERMEAIEKYCSRYLKQNETYRSSIFIRLLIQVPLASFHKEGVFRKTEKLLNKLQEAPLELANQTHEIEIIPYEVLWGLAVRHLDRKFFASPYESRLEAS